MTDRIAEQDSLERLIGRLLQNATVFESADNIGSNIIGNDFREAADTLSQMRDALEPIAAACDQYVADWRSDDFPVPVYIKAGDLRKARALLTTTKIEKE